MAAFNSLARDWKMDWGNPSEQMTEEGQLDQIDQQNALKMRDATLAKRKAAAEFQSQRRLTTENKSAFGSVPRDDTNFVAEMSGLRKPPEAKWWGANDQQMMASPTANATPGGARLMGRGDNFDDETSPYRVLSGLTSNRTPQPGTPSPGAASGGGEVTMSPGGNYSRGPAMDDMGIEALKQAKLKTTTMEQQVPSEMAERARNLTNFDIGTGQTARQERAAGDIARDEHFRTRQALAGEMKDPTIYSAEVTTPEYYKQEAFQRELEKIEKASEANARVWKERGQGNLAVAQAKGDSAETKALLDNLGKLRVAVTYTDAQAKQKAEDIAALIQDGLALGIPYGAMQDIIMPRSITQRPAPAPQLPRTPTPDGFIG